MSCGDGTLRRGPAPVHRDQSGFALLFVFLLAACVAITLYVELPRIAFEAERAREQSLIDRGQDYPRAIKMYYRMFRRYPAKLEDLENTNNLRFLRRRYKDPLTGKDEWRLIHMGPAGVLTDSLVQKLDQHESANKMNRVDDPQAGEDAPAAGVANVSAGSRASDRLFPGQNGAADPSAGQSSPGGAVSPDIATATQVQPYSSNPTGTPAPSAAAMIQRLLTTPRGQLPQPSGAPPPDPGIIAPAEGLRRVSTPSAIGGIGVGIAGVASTAPGSGIKVINGRQKFKEWEFVYDFKTDTLLNPVVQPPKK